MLNTIPTVRYKGSEISVFKFLDLKEVDHDRKLVYSLETVSLDVVPLIAADLASRVLSFYEKSYPADSRVRDAISAARRIGEPEHWFESIADGVASAAIAASAASFNLSLSASDSYATSAAALAANAAQYAVSSAQTAHADSRIYHTAIIKSACAAAHHAAGAAANAAHMNSKHLEEKEQIKILKKWLIWSCGAPTDKNS